MTTLPANERLIVALDVDTRAEASEIVDELGDTVSFYKVGWRAFVREGFGMVDWLIGGGKRVFLDLKMDDIEQTIESALANFPDHGIEFLTIHGNGATAQAARRGRGGRGKPKLLSLTYLSSLDETDLKDILGTSKVDLTQHIINRSRSALAAGIEGLIASGQSIRAIRKAVQGDYLIVAPGIRADGNSQDDHKRTLTPYDAIRAGADYLVVGRPITKARDRGKAAAAIIADINEALER
ncbi:MAG: orotidine-5'-phosphate decarboxylase [Gammaproteobacteria bacterium]